MKEENFGSQTISGSILPQENTRTKRTIGSLQLTFIGITSMVGSGWLFGTFHCAKIAGPASILAWVIGAFALLLVALTIAELGALFTQSGGIARYLDYTHGSLAGFLGGWINWLGIVACLPIEALASVQYLSFIHGFHGLFNHHTETLSNMGLSVASGLIVIYFFLNYWTLKLFLQSILLTTIFKLLVPVLAVAAIIWAGFEPSNFGHDFQTVFPYGVDAIFIAVASGGVIFAFNGFQSIVNFAGEAKNPTRTIPISLISSILLCLLIYIFLQIGFIGGLSKSNLIHGWHGLDFSSPFVELAISFNLNLVAMLLYIDAVVSPSGTGIAYTGSSARMLFGMQRSGYMPQKLGVLHPVHAIPRNALLVGLILSFVFLWVFRGWGKLASLISVMNSLSYLSGPIAVMGLRRIAPNWRSPCRIPGMPFIAPVAFAIVSLIIYWSRWPLTGEVLIAAFGGLCIYLYYQKQQKWRNIQQHLKNGTWLIFYLITIAFLSWLGDKNFGGINYIKDPYDQILVVIVSLIFYVWGVKSAWTTPMLQTFRTDKNML